ncbi:MAG: aminoacetone oxidase family FAD-binding enzyme [Ruminococcaceae bacterium]|nr:aminoacetone oxidase family FAD-binding enzyme [Oscillospiraceae bacterium]
MLYDILVIGGGAAGLVAAICAKRKNNKLNILVCESADRVCKKLITTGNGRCNITNKNADITKYHGTDVSYAKKVFDKYFVNDTVEFFSSIGVEIIFEEDGRAYPYSYQASSVVDALRFAADELGIATKCDCKVLDFDKKDNFAVKTTAGEFTAKSLIVTGGMLSGGKSVGSDGSVFQILKSKSFKAAKTTPAIVQLKTETDITRQLKGIKVNANASLLLGGKKSRTEYGEVLFTDYGLSGPPILQISREAARTTLECQVVLDLAVEYSFEDLKNLLLERRQNLKNRTLENFLTGFLNKRLGQVILKKCGLKLTDSVAKISDKDIINIAEAIKNLTFKVLDTTGFNNSQVTAGGILTGEFDECLQSKKYKGLFAAGEILDIDGDCGGYNLQWAWSSGMLASVGAVKYIGDKK